MVYGFCSPLAANIKSSGLQALEDSHLRHPKYVVSSITDWRSRWVKSLQSNKRTQNTPFALKSDISEMQDLLESSAQYDDCWPPVPCLV